MKIGQVIGRLTLSQAESALKGGRWLVVAPLTHEQLAGGKLRPLSDEWNLVVYDNLGAGQGDLIGYVEGAEATQPFDQPTPLDAYNVCLIDNIHYQPPEKQPLAAS